MYSKIEFSVEGVCPLMIHNGRLANPMDPYARQIKVITSKGKKTESDYEEIARLEHEGGLYLNDAGRVIVPSNMIEGAITEGAKKSKRGKLAKAGMFVVDDALLEYDGPQDAKGLWQDRRFVDQRIVKVGMARVLRTRPIFRDWRFKFVLNYLPDVLNRHEIVEAISVAGVLIGLGEMRPRYGRYDVANAVDLKSELKKAS